MKEQFLKFFQENVLGRILETDEVVYSLEQGKLQGFYSDQMIFSDLSATEYGIQFNMTTVTKEKIYKVDADGSRGEVTKDFTGTSVFHYELACRKSSSQITGYVRCLSSTVREHTMEAVVYGVYNILIEKGQLKWNEQQLFYRDNPAGENKYHPVAFDSSIRFYMENDKLTFEYLPVYYNVDPATMHRTLSKDKYPPFIAKEK